MCLHAVKQFRLEENPSALNKPVLLAFFSDCSKSFLYIIFNIKLLLDKGMKRIDLAAAANLTSNTLAKLGKNKEVSMETLNKICNQLDCRIEDILEHIPD